MGWSQFFASPKGKDKVMSNYIKPDDENMHNPDNPPPVEVCYKCRYFLNRCHPSPCGCCWDEYERADIAMWSI